MSAYSDLVNTFSPRIYYRMGDSASPLTDEEFNRDAICFNSPTFDVLGAIDGDADTAVTFNGTNQYAKPTLGYDLFPGYAAWSIACWVKFDANTSNIFDLYGGSNNWINLSVDSATGITASTKQFATIHTATATGIDFSNWRLVVMTWNAGVFKLYVDDTLEDTDTDTNYTTWFSLSLAIWIARGNAGGYYAGSIDELAFLPSELGATDVADLYAYAPFPVTPASDLSMQLQGFVTSPAADLPMQLLGPSTSAAASIPALLQGITSTDSTVVAAHWDLSLTLDGVEIGNQLVGQVSIEQQERTSSLASFQFIPSAGAIDPDAFERKDVLITFRRVDAAGALIYSSRRFTGLSSSAYYDPDTGIVRVDATTDLQGRFENTERASIAAAIPNAQWSEHIFDDSADGWRYAQDLLSTTPEDCYLDQNGYLRITPWAAKATADLELTDDAVEDKPISLTRTKRRDLLTRVRVNLDFRFVRLRHREMAVRLQEQSFCDWLELGFNIPSKSMVQNAADSNAWTRTTDFTFNSFPVPGIYCSPPRAWADNADNFCLSASWTAARRWAQTVTEEYALIIYCPDMEESVGQQETNEDYGIEATYDASDYERITEFNGPPTGSTLDSGNSEDYIKDATASETDGRTAMEAAQVVAIARASTTVLDRARRNRLTFFPVYNPFIDLTKTLRLNTTYVTAKGKVYRLTEKFDTGTGELVMKVELALSRHGGSGLAVTDPQDSPAEPPAPTETATTRNYVLPWHIGGIGGALPEDPDWDGMITNVDPFLQEPGEELYEAVKLVVKMPEIEEAARNSTAVQAEQLYELAVPEDELTMSY